MTVSSLEYPSVLNTLKDNKFASGATPTNLSWSAQKEMKPQNPNSLITLSGYDASHVGTVAKVVHRVIVGIWRRVWPVPVSNKVISTKHLESRTDTATQLSYIQVRRINNQEVFLDVSYRRVSVLDAAIDNSNSGPSSQDTISVQLLYTSDAMDRVIRRSGIVTEGLPLDRVQDPDAR